MTISTTASGVNNLTAHPDQSGLISASDGTNLRFGVGLFPGGAFKMKLSKAGNEVLTTADSNLIWSSDFNSFKIVKTGTVSFTKAANALSGSASITHGQTVTPAVVAFWVDTTGTNLRFPLTHVEITTAGLVYQQYDFQVWDIAIADQIDFKLFTPNVAGGSYASSIPVTMRYYILVETAGS